MGAGRRQLTHHVLQAICQCRADCQGQPLVGGGRSGATKGQGVAEEEEGQDQLEWAKSEGRWLPAYTGLPLDSSKEAVPPGKGGQSEETFGP